MQFFKSPAFKAGQLIYWRIPQQMLSKAPLGLGMSSSGILRPAEYLP